MLWSKGSAECGIADGSNEESKVKEWLGICFGLRSEAAVRYSPEAEGPAFKMKDFAIKERQDLKKTVVSKRGVLP